MADRADLFYQLHRLRLVHLCIFDRHAKPVYYRSDKCIFRFWSFTPLHEAVHRNLSTINWLNDSIGTLSAQLLLPGFSTSLYRYLHVTHHARTGQDNDRI